MMTGKRALQVCRVIGIFILLTGVMMMGSGRGYPESQKIAYERYESKDPQIGIATEQIAGWTASESRGSYEPYAMVVFYEARREEKGFRAEMVVTVTDSTKTSVSPTLEAMVTDLLGRRQQLPDQKVLSQSQGKVLDAEARVVELSYKVPASLNALERRLTPIREKVVLFVRGTQLYQVRYVNTEDEYPRFEEAFEHLVASLRFSSPGGS